MSSAAFVENRMGSSENIVFILALRSSWICGRPVPLIRELLRFIWYSWYYLRRLERSGSGLLHSVRKFIWIAVHPRIGAEWSKPWAFPEYKNRRESIPWRKLRCACALFRLLWCNFILAHILRFSIKPEMSLEKLLKLAMRYDATRSLWYLILYVFLWHVKNVPIFFLEIIFLCNYTK